MDSHNDQMRRMARLFVIYRTLEMRADDRRIQRGDLQALCDDCSTKTIDRELKILNEAGARIVFDFRKGSYVLERPLPSFSVDLQLSDLLALLLGQGSSGQQFSSAAAMPGRALEKLFERLPLELRRELASARDVLDLAAPGRRDYSGAPLQDLVAAAQASRTIEMTYYSIGRDATELRRVDPLALTTRGGGFLNLVAFCHKRREVLLFSLDNIRGLRCTDDRFQADKEFDLAKYLHGMVGGLRGELTDIELRFLPHVARYARKIRWEFPHVIEETEAGLIMRGQVSGLQAISKEVLRWGANVEVLSPPELRQAVLQEAEAIRQIYLAPEKI